MDNQKILRAKEVAEMTGVTTRALHHWRQTGQGPAFLRLSRKCVRYERVEVERWIAEKRMTIEPTSMRGGAVTGVGEHEVQVHD